MDLQTATSVGRREAAVDDRIEAAVQLAERAEAAVAAADKAGTQPTPHERFVRLGERIIAFADRHADVSVEDAGGNNHSAGRTHDGTIEPNPETGLGMMLQAREARFPASWSVAELQEVTIIWTRGKDEERKPLAGQPEQLTIAEVQDKNVPIRVLATLYLMEQSMLAAEIAAGKREAA
jgi:hypothetical protein